MIHFTLAELAAMRRADEEIERKFRLTGKERAASRALDREVLSERQDCRARRTSDSQREYYRKNREKRREYRRAYYAKNQEDPDIQRKAAVLRELRKQAGYSQAALAQLLGISSGSIAQYETGRVPFDPSIFASVFPGASWEVPDEP